MTADAIDSRKLDISRVLAGTFQVIGRNFLTFAVLAFVLSGIPTGIVTYLQASWLAGQADALESGNFALGQGYFTNLAIGGLAAVITTAILQGALVYATVQDMNGRKPAVGEALATGLRSFLPLIGVSILFALAVFLGMILLIVPGIMIACAWCVAVPSLVADRTGVFGAFSRAADLTRGNRWRIFALGLLLFVILLVLSAVLGSISAALLLSTPGALNNPAAIALSPLSILINVLQQTINAVIGAALVSVLYVELRRAREGAGPQWLADIFG